MARHADSQVDLTGHTDPIGTTGANYALGLRRAEAVKEVLVANGADPKRIKVESAGKEQLASADPKKFNLDRRAQFVWSNAPAEIEPGADIPLELAHRAMVSAVGPPYRKVEGFVPHAVEEMSMVTKNVDLEDWHWGSMPPNVVAGLDFWLKKNIGPEVAGGLVQVPESLSVGFGGLAVHPRAVVESAVDDLLANPTAFLSTAFGKAAGK
jgi:hypothetical protein